MRRRSMWIRLFAAAALLPAALVQAAQSFESPPQQVALLELFTSEGCSSCPPADAWLSTLVRDPRLWQTLVPVAFHVDYWDGPGWQDRFATPAFSARQRRHVGHGLVRQVYTPGFVVAGHSGRAGSGRDPGPAAPAAGVLRATLDGQRIDVRYTRTGADGAPGACRRARFRSRQRGAGRRERRSQAQARFRRARLRWFRTAPGRQRALDGAGDAAGCAGCRLRAMHWRSGSSATANRRRCRRPAAGWPCRRRVRRLSAFPSRTGRRMDIFEPLPPPRSKVRSQRGPRDCARRSPSSASRITSEKLRAVDLRYRAGAGHMARWCSVAMAATTNRAAAQTILKMAAANGVARVLVGRGPAVDAGCPCDPARAATGGIVLSASHNPGGPRPTSASSTTLATVVRRPRPSPGRSMPVPAASEPTASPRLPTWISTPTANSALGPMQVVVIDPVAVEYAALMARLFDFDAIRALFANGFRMRFDAMNAVTGPYAHELLERRLGAPAGTVLRVTPLETWRRRPDRTSFTPTSWSPPWSGPDAPDFGATSDGDGDRNMIPSGATST